MNRIVYKSVLVLVLVGCGGGDSTTITTTTTTSPPPVVSNIKKVNNVELGPVQGANVAISTLDGQQFLYSTVTDENGKYTIDVNEFEKNLRSLTVYPNYVLVSATNGLDIDPEDDGDTTNSDPIPVDGTVKGIFKVSTLLNNEDLSINLLSTAIAEILEDKNKIDSEQIAYVAQELGLEDINGDGKIDNQDIYLYRMSEHSSEIEDKLRERFLGAIHNNNETTLQEVTDELREQYNLMFISYVVNGSVANLTIEHSKKDSQILYKVNAVKNDLFTDIYSSPISLNKNDYIVYKECKDNRCSTVQIASFDGSEVHQYFLRISDFGIYKDVAYMNALRQSIIDNSKKVETIEVDIKNLNNEIEGSQEEIDRINSTIEEIRNDTTNYEF